MLATGRGGGVRSSMSPVSEFPVERLPGVQEIAGLTPLPPPRHSSKLFMPVILAREVEARGLAIQGHEFKASLDNSRTLSGKMEEFREEGRIEVLRFGSTTVKSWHFLYGSPHT